MNHWVNFNGTFLKEETPLVGAGSRGLRYGDGIFETMKVIDGGICLREFHTERFFKGVRALKIALPPNFNEVYFQEEVRKTIERNLIKGAAKVRLMVFRGEGALNDTTANSHYIIQCEALTGIKPALNENGLKICVYLAGRKSVDEFSSLKTNNFLLYAMAAMYAKDHGYNDCIVLNSFARICDSTISNVFWLKNEVIYTPPLSEGCIAGVMRRHLLQVLPHAGYAVTEQPVSVGELEQADEVFLTNAITGLRWVGTLNGNRLKNSITSQVFESCV